MEDIRKADPTFTGFVPRTALDAVDRYVRCRRNGLKPMLVPECLIACAPGLSPEELELFETWIINPNGSLEGVELVPDDTIRASNEKVFRETEDRMRSALEPPLPLELPELPELPEEAPDRCAPATPAGTPST